MRKKKMEKEEEKIGCFIKKKWTKRQTGRRMNRRRSSRGKKGDEDDISKTFVQSSRVTETLNILQKF